MDNNERYERAKKRVEAMKGFYVHFVVYVAVIVFLFIIDAFGAFSGGSSNNWWVHWPAMGWGIAIVIHAASVFGPFEGSDWEDRKIKEMMDKEAKKH